MMFSEIPSKFDPPSDEKRILDFWDRNGIYAKSLERRRGAPSFVFYEGPPTANGLPHPGHCLTRVIKDLFLRYRTMCGFYCERQAGWDTHGLPVEVEVSKELGIHSKEEIEKYGIEPFNHRCLESVFRYTKEWEELTRRLGFWVDLERAYVTYHQSYVESVWWALKTLFDAGLLYRGHKIVWWWAQGGTALSSGEVGQGYREVADPSVFVSLPVVGQAHASLLVWTTTPWTLPANQFVAVHPDLEYSLARDVSSGQEFYIVSSLVADVAKRSKRNLEIVRTFRGADLIGLRYVPPFDFYFEKSRDRKALLSEGGDDYIGWRVVAGKFVTTDTGTGLVHQAPAFGEADFDLLRSERERFADPEAVPLLCPVAPDGTFTAEVPAWQGRWVKEADKDIARALKASGRLFHQEQFLHDYPFCWRADQDPLIQYPRESWFIRTTEFARDMLDNNRQINWLPGHIRDGRFGKFLESNVDWSLSRERYWGTPLPIWVCEKTGYMEAVASYAELLAKSGVAGMEAFAAAGERIRDISPHLKVHRPYIDEITYGSPKAAGARMRRVPEVIDCWFDAGAMPFAQFGWPHRGGGRFAAAFPADFITEALDQTRGWFYSLLAISTMLFGKHGVAKADAAAGLQREWPQPFRNCIVLGLLMGEDGQKMSKQKRNYKTPDQIFENEGADAMRWLFFSGQPPWTSIRFQESSIKEGQREFLLRLYNVYSFFVIYANIDGWRPAGGLAGNLPDADLSELDRWILSELNRTIRDIRTAMDAYDNFGAARRLNDFVDGLSNWYVRRSRERFWKSGMDADKKSAYSTLYRCLVNVSLLGAPFVPFMSESLYRNLVGSREDTSLPESVHLCDYPVADASRIDETLSDRMGVLLEIASLGRAARVQARLKVRQPLAQVDVVLADRTHEAWLERHAALIADELNVKVVELIVEGGHYVDYLVKPDFRSIGPKYGKLAKRIEAALLAVGDPAALRRRLNDAGEIHLSVDDRDIKLTAEDVQIELRSKEGWVAAQGRSAVVVLNTGITEELRREGLAREIVHRIQGIRKELGMRYEQRIALGLDGDAGLLSAARMHGDYIRGETLAEEISGPGQAAPNEEAQIEGQTLRIWVIPL
jgi:isoleucyl-tRNA synthetase